MEVVALALVLDAAIGDPDRVWRRVPHPVALFGGAIEIVDRTLNAGSLRRAKGALAIALLIGAFALPAALIEAALTTLHPPLALLATAAVGSVLLAHNSLHAHVARVADAPDIAAARQAVAMIVGREVATLDREEVSGAALEALAESLSDAVVAPAFWFAIGGLPGLVAYKVLNTADSMIGHRTARHEAFGAATARLDDLANLVPARLSALLILIASRTPALMSVAREAPRHASPNAGWPEAALARALGVSLGGPRRYGEHSVDGVVLNPSGRPPSGADLRRGLAISTRVGVVHALAYAALAFL